MTPIFRNFRRWWQPPRKYSEPQTDRSVSFLELFYDLIYVVVVAELAHALATQPDLNGVGKFAFLFVIVWWSWINGTSYHDFHGNNDIRTRVFTFLQMFAVAGMAVFAHNALGEGSTGFAIFYGLFLLIITFLWWRTGVYDPDHRPTSKPYVSSYLTSASLFFASIFVPAPYKFVLWGIGIFITIIQPLRQNSSPQIAEDSASHEDAQIIGLSPALVERLGLFTILVLAEVLVGVVQGLAENHHLTPFVFVIGGLGLCVAFAIWWLYFDLISHRPPEETRIKIMTWIYMHLFVTMSIVTVGAAILNVVEHAEVALPADVRWLLIGGITLFLLSMVPLMRVIKVMPEAKSTYNIGSITLLVIAVFVAMLGFFNLSILPLLLSILGLLTIPIGTAVIFWITVLDATDSHAS